MGHPATVSVIIPSYNHENYVGPAIKSVLEQDYSDYELLIRDDCSTDRTVERIKAYLDRRIQTEFSSDNLGATINLVRLIDRAKGKYIALLNSDDLWKPTKLGKQVEFLEAHPDVAACFTWSDFIDENGAVIQTDTVFNQPNRSQAQWIEHFFTQGNCLCHPSILIRREVYEAIGTYNLAMRQLPDFDMWVRLVKHYRIHVIQEPLTSHRRFINTGENTSTPTISNSIRDVNESLHILMRFFDSLDDELFAEAFRHHFRNRSSGTQSELLCEKFFLMLDGKYYMGVIPVFAAIHFYLDICGDSEVVDAFREKFGFTLQDFHRITGKIDLAGLLPAQAASVSEACPDVDVDRYIRHHRMRSIVVALMRKESRIYGLLAKLNKRFSNTAKQNRHL